MGAIKPVDWAAQQDEVVRVLRMLEAEEGVGHTLLRVCQELPERPPSRLSQAIVRLEIAGRVERSVHRQNGTIRLVRCKAPVAKHYGGAECGKLLPCPEHGGCNHQFHRNAQAGKAGACPGCGATAP